VTFIPNDQWSPESLTGLFPDEVVTRALVRDVDLGIGGFRGVAPRANRAAMAARWR
jgi:hypothetical protein